MSNTKQRHGRTDYYIAGEGFVADSKAFAAPRTAIALESIEGSPSVEDALPGETTRAFRFCRMFPDLLAFRPDDAGLINLGKTMSDDRDTLSADSHIPSGFTYLGQFVDHDITFDRTVGIPDGMLDPAEIVQGRTPSLELDSLYGRGPSLSAELYEVDGMRLKIGVTTGRPDFGVTATFSNDLPRRPSDDPSNPKQAILGDPRNDENLIVAQTHVAFIKFHNRVIEFLRTEGTSPIDLFEAARKIVVQHYQSIVLYDLVRRLVDPSIFDDVLKNGRRFFLPNQKPERSALCMPVEFSVAAYRLGHSLVRNNYEWNRVFNSTGITQADLGLFFTFSQVSGDLGGEPALPSDWIVDWRRMYDFSEQPGGSRHPQLNFTRPLDTHLARKLKGLPEFASANPQDLKSLAVRNLLRGRLVGLPTGQDVASKFCVAPLTPAEIASGPNAVLISDLQFDKKTPLWFYILKEAEVRHSGEHLGEVGSRIIVETFHAIVEGSDFSILAESNWKTTLPSEFANHFTMNELLLFVNDLNPIGD